MFNLATTPLIKEGLPKSNFLLDLASLLKFVCLVANFITRILLKKQTIISLLFKTLVLKIFIISKLAKLEMVR